MAYEWHDGNQSKRFLQADVEMWKNHVGSVGETNSNRIDVRGILAHIKAFST